MPSRSIRRAVLAGAAVATATATLTASPASAGSMFSMRDSGRTASVEWSATGESSAMAGNTFRGELQIDDLGSGTANVHGYVDNFDCDPGEVPWGDYWGDPACDELDRLEVTASGATFSMDRKFGSATLSATVELSSWSRPTSSTATVNLTWTGEGDITTSTETVRSKEGDTTYQSRHTVAQREAMVVGDFGGLSIADSGTMRSYRMMNRARAS